mmetsp:Transcript_13270/g.38134  ORF Transcript_13270/g.38134 Transcript_13270/m.38134 type:complete len:361 (+) Transcript_13270:69-1151(+)
MSGHPTHTASRAAAAFSGIAIAAMRFERNGKPCTSIRKRAFQPTCMAVLEAVRSLYDDEVRPSDRVLRKRLLEQCEDGSTMRGCFTVSLRDLRRLCEECEELEVEEGSAEQEWSVALRGHPETFIDLSSSEDAYPATLWHQLEAHFGAGIDLPGGRFVCAENLVRDGLPFLAGYSLGRVYHIVQLAISKQILVYRHGKLVSPRHLEVGAGNAASPVDAEAVELPIATWQDVIVGVRSLFRTAPSQDRHIPLSNVKRLFRCQLSLNLDADALGLKRMSEVFQSSELIGVCTMQRRKNGLVIVPSELEPIEPLHTQNGQDALSQGCAEQAQFADELKAKLASLPPSLWAAPQEVCGARVTSL